MHLSASDRSMAGYHDGLFCSLVARPLTLPCQGYSKYSIVY